MLGALFATGLALLAPGARSADAPEQLFRAGIAAMQRGAHDEAIDDFELLSDRGFVHPDASFDRGVAYAERASGPAARPGDLGRAAAAFSEAQLLRPEDDGAERALETVRSEIARRRAREGASVLLVQKKLSRAAVELLSEDTWAVCAVLGSLLLTLALAVLRVARTPALRLTATTAGSLATLVLVSCGGMAAAAQYYRLHTEPAVVVTSEARLLDESGAPLVQKNGVPEVVAIPEGARVDVLERRETLVRVEWGTTRGFVTLGQLRILERP